MAEELTDNTDIAEEDKSNSGKEKENAEKVKISETVKNLSSKSLKQLQVEQ